MKITIQNGELEGLKEHVKKTVKNKQLRKKRLREIDEEKHGKKIRNILMQRNPGNLKILS